MRISDWSSDVCSSDLPATNPAQADLVVNMGYHVDTGREKVVNDLIGGPNRYGWGWPWYSRSYFYGFHDPFFANDVSSYTVYPREIDTDHAKTAHGERGVDGTAPAEPRTRSISSARAHPVK